MTFKLGRMSDMQLRKVDPYVVEMKINQKKVDLEIDTGCSLTLMNENQFKSLWSETERPKVKPIRIKVETYTGDPVGVVGVAKVQVAKTNAAIGDRERRRPQLVGTRLVGEHSLELKRG